MILADFFNPLFDTFSTLSDIAFKKLHCLLIGVVRKSHEILSQFVGGILNSMASHPEASHVEHETNSVNPTYQLCWDF